MKKRALISVFDKTGIVEFAKGLTELDWEIISTGGTARLLSEQGIDVIDVDDLTKFPEILDGRVKTLNPLIHGGILFRRELESHQKTVEEMEIHPIDMVVNSLYPFEEVLKNPNATHEELVENIDIGGPSMIRAAAKNYRDVLIVTDASDYDTVLEALKSNSVDIVLKEELARKAFSYTAYYDSLIANYFNDKLNVEYPEKLTNGYFLKQDLHYGENPHQSAKYYESAYKSSDFNIEQLHGKELSYNNLNDVYGVLNALKAFDRPSVVAVKHTNPCGIGSADNIYDAYIKAYESDTESIFGGVIGLNREVSVEIAEKLNAFFVEIVIAPSYSKEAIEVLSSKKNIRLLEISNLNDIPMDKHDIKQVLNGVLLQEHDNISEAEEEFAFEVVTDRMPTEAELVDLKFAWAAAKGIASNGVLIAKDGGTIGIGQGEVRRSWAVEEAIARAGDKIAGAVVASDGFFFADTIELLHAAGVVAVVQPGGSIHDAEVIELANKYNMSLILTGIRHFRH